MIGVARLIIDPLQHLQSRPVVGFKAEVIGFIMPGFIGQPVCVVLVAGKARPAASAHREQF
jgi:hypothetical protein